MNIKKILLYSLIISLISINIWSVNRISGSGNASVKGISTSNAKILKITPSQILPTIPTPTEITPSKASLPMVQPTSQAKQKGGWYWNSELKKSQVWLGTDSTGKDIWTDSYPSPSTNSIPAAQKQSSQQENSKGGTEGTSSQNTNTTGTSSTVTVPYHQ